jgi:hypothetical protein
MGFRSTVISEDWNIDWPIWFREKWEGWINDQNMISSPFETKYPGEIAEDIQLALMASGYFQDSYEREYCLAVLHECGGITKIQIGENYIYTGSPTEWDVEKSDDWVNGQHGHCYCSNCTDLRRYDAAK